MDPWAWREIVARSARELRRGARHWRGALLDRAPKLIVLVYHRVMREAGWNPLGTIVSEAAFRRQLDAVARRYPVISLRDAGRQFAAGEAAAPVQVALTFDDGYRDNHDVVLPIMREKGLPASFFVVTGFVGSGRSLWDWEVLRQLRAHPDLDTVEMNGAPLRRGAGESPMRFAWRVNDALKAAGPDAMRRALDGLRARTGADPAAQHPEERCLTWEEVRALRRQGMEIGAHSRWHQPLARLGDREAVEEIRESKAAVERELGEPCAHFAFPFGSPLDFTEAHIEAVRATGFDTCLLNVHGYNRLGASALRLKRVIMSDWTHTGALLG